MESSNSLRCENPYASPRSVGGDEQRRTRRWRRCGVAAARVWVAFSLSLFVATLAVAYFETENLLTSDDAYDIGLPIALFCTGFALVRGIAEAAGASVTIQRLAYFAPPAVLMLLCFGYDATHPSSDLPGFVTYCGTAIAAIGTAVYPFIAARISRTYLALASIPAVVFLVGYVHAMTVRGKLW